MTATSKPSGIPTANEAPLDIVIAGAGIGGLTAALALAQHGHAVRVLERAPRPRDAGAGLQQGPNAMAVHAALGIAGRLKTVAFAPEFAALMDGRSGRVRLRADLAGHRVRYGQPYLHIHRADLYAVLLEAARSAGVAVSTGCDVTGYDLDDGGVTVHNTCADIRADVLIGADGIRSAVAGQMLGERTARFTGNAAWRAVIPADAVPDGLIPPAANVWMGAGRHLVAYYLKGGELINIVAVVETGEWIGESWTTPGDPDALRAAFTAFEPRVQVLLEAVQSCHLWGLFDHPPLPRWTDGPVALLGDAAHPMLPFMAQGASMAVEDAWVLAQALSGEGSVTARLSAYAAARRPRTTRLQAISTANASLYHRAPGPGRLWRNAKLAVASALPGLAERRLGAIYGYDVTREKSPA